MKNIKVGDIIRKAGEDYKVLDINLDGDLTCCQPDTYFIPHADLKDFEIKIIQ